MEELEWATGMDVTGGKQFELNVFDRDRLRDRMVRPPLFAHLPCILFWCLLSQCSSRDKRVLHSWMLEVETHSRGHCLALSTQCRRGRGLTGHFWHAERCCIRQGHRGVGGAV